MLQSLTQKVVLAVCRAWDFYDIPTGRTSEEMLCKMTLAVKLRQIGLTYAAIARTTGLHVGTIRYYRRRLPEEIKTKIEEWNPFEEGCDDFQTAMLTWKQGCHSKEAK